jgi:adenosylcobinamide kinase/adenosylcobinamide-phosphate guanylyltransferase
MSPSRLVLVGGSVRSGKSRFALDYARRHGPRIGLVATATAMDDAEMHERIARHRAERAPDIATVEEPIDAAAAVARLATQGCSAVVVDCLTLWLTNLVLNGESEAACLERVAALCASATAHSICLVLVSNELGMGLVPESALGRSFRDLVGRVHQRLAPGADEIYLATMGVLLRLHPAPVTTYFPGQ